MTFNMWHGGDAGKQPLSKSLEMIRDSGADIICIQEALGFGDHRPDNSAAIARELGWNHVSQDARAIISRHDVIETTPSKNGAKLKIAENRYVWVFNCHLMYIPYQPYQLADKPYGDFPFIKTEDEAIHWAKVARGDEVQKIANEIKQKMEESWPVILTGDFNEPSHLDWTKKAANAGLHPIKVEWPATKAFADIGMKDAWRVVYPDEVAFAGETWTPINREGEIHDRIDFIFFAGRKLKITNTQIIGEAEEKADIVVPYYPSDHRAVMASFKWQY
ncbi:MAG: endonuclease/exonuclease/phosphatase family protein [Prolixibacteraceae bacterium]|nr:endonuclease/exonuclease/phosphatase family protein [Prolixibacteraceae bacterium]